MAADERHAPDPPATGGKGLWICSALLGAVALAFLIAGQIYLDRDTCAPMSVKERGGECLDLGFNAAIGELLLLSSGVTALVAIVLVCLAARRGNVVPEVSRVEAPVAALPTATARRRVHW